jgi:hypothetical protein
MKLLWILSAFLFTNFKLDLLPNKIDKSFNNIYNKLNLPLWHKNNIECHTDEDCPVPYACCHDPFFPMKNMYCCTNYKKREYKYAYNYAYNN